MTKRSASQARSFWARSWVTVVCVGLSALMVSVALAQAPVDWNRGLGRGQVLRAHYFTAPYQGWYCVRTVDDTGRVQGWRQEEHRRTHMISGSIGIPGLASLQAGLGIIGPAADPPPETAAGHTRLRLAYRGPTGRGVREYAGAIPEPVRALLSMVNSALPGSGGCSF